MPGEAARDLYGRLRSFLPGVALDVGCGVGSVAAGLGGPLVLLDAVDLRGPLASDFPFVLGDACALPFASASVGGVHLARVLHHVSDWRLALSEARRVVRPGGAVAVTLGGRMFASALAPLRDAVFEEGQRLGIAGAHHVHGPTGYEDVDSVLGAGEVVEVAFPQFDTPRQVAVDAAGHPYAWLPGQDLSPLQAVAERLLAEWEADPDEPVEHERVISYRVYARGND
ncbi:class I SAM-dependent methyltransferase [Kutzneria buriramensis]|nr:class I SAM-dependent methyltransferase [Kutzneria buriramensis]